MKTITLAFYKGIYSTSLVNILISIFTLSKYSHVELIINEISYSSRPESNGFSGKKIDYNKDIHLWDFIELEVSVIDILSILKLVKNTNGRTYDWLGIFFWHLIPIGIEDPKRWYCSEWIAKAFDVMGIRLSRSIQVTPGKLYKLVQKAILNGDLKLKIYKEE